MKAPIKQLTKSLRPRNHSYLVQHQRRNAIAESTRCGRTVRGRENKEKEKYRLKEKKGEAVEGVAGNL